VRGIQACVAVAVALLAAAPGVASAHARKHEHKQKDEHVQVLAINDLHGNLLPPTGSSGAIQVGPATTDTVAAGGVEYLKTWVDRLRKRRGHDASYFVGAGDLIGGSPLLSGLFHDEPTIEALNLMHMRYSSVGNHEFDEGVNELRRMQRGGCHPVDGCQDGDPFTGAAFKYLAANVLFEKTHRTIFPPYKVVKAGNAKLAFIGLTLQGTPSIVTPSGVAGLEFKPEARTINRLVRKLRRRRGVRAFVVLLHQGGQQNPPYPLGYQDVNRCDNLSGDLLPILSKLSKQVDVVASAHTHQAYNCRIGGRLVTSAASFGRLVTDIELTIDHRTKDVSRARARNVIVDHDVRKAKAETKLIAKYDKLAGPIAHRVVGSITADITREPTTAGESALGDVIADAQLEATSPSDFGGAVVAFMNPGGIRADLIYANQDGSEAPGQVTYNELFTVQPFNNVMMVKTMTGDMIRRLLEQQFDNPSTGQTRFLQVSRGFHYDWNGSAPAGRRISNITIDGVPVDPNGSYRVAMNNFLAGGGDGFTVFNEGTDPLGGAIDIDAFADYIEKHSPVAPGPKDRFTKVG
jgi:5'-nucleotidase